MFYERLLLSETLLYIAAAVFPAAILLTMIYRLDHHEKEPLPLLAKLFFLGVLSALPATILELFLQESVLPTLPIYSYNTYFILLATMIGLVEEGCKYFFLYRTVWHDPSFDYQYDAIVYSVFVSLGFATIENILYVMQMGLSVAISRAILAVPAHMSFAVFMGALLGAAKLEEVKGRHAMKKRNLILAYLIPVFLHAFYDAAALIGSGLSMIIFFVFVALMFYTVRKLVVRQSKQDKPIY